MKDKILMSLVVAAIVTLAFWYFWPKFFDNSLQKALIFGGLILFFLLILRPIISFIFNIIIVVIGIIIIWYVINHFLK